ncbi:MAG TPA: ABC transporter substrate-binding protein [Acidimicrobiia bacterium]|nr:ABC transporter substrate-binding protein [Acidimicrobiia bacterium]
MRFMIALLVLALVAAACGDDDDAGTTQATTATTAATTTTAAAATTTAAANVADNPDFGVTSDTIKIGWMGDATGPTASAQALNLYGSQAFVAWLNANGGVQGREIELVVKDDEFNAEKALTNFTSLVQDEKVLGIIHLGGSHISTAIMPEVGELGIPVIGQPQNIDIQLLTPNSYNNIAHYGDQADVATLRMADLLGGVENVKVMVIQLELPSGDEWNAYIENSVTGAGGTYVGRLLLNAGAPDYTGVVTELGQKVDAGEVNYVAFHGAPAHALGTLTEMKTQGVEVPFVGIHGLAGSTVYTEGQLEAGDVVEGIHSFLPATSDCEGCGMIRDFVAGTEWEEDVVHINFTHGWVDMMITVQAIERAAAGSGELSWTTMNAALTGGPFDVSGLTCDTDWSSQNFSPCATPFAWNYELGVLEPVGGFAQWASALDGEYFLFTS